ncbi:MAG TPA: adenosylcobinamide amidohydrolase [Dongiaceae bacterium]|nr:adenosylcobinamide amidohydrolase [Dongiaceae bacterium]
MLATGSCVWNGGSAVVTGWLNLRVPKDAPTDVNAILESPAASLQRYAQDLAITTPLAGMMTAAWMDSLRFQLMQNSHTALACIVTSGIENARRSGDPCDADFSHQHLTQAGTINIALVSTAAFSPAACIEALLVATEAKTAACHDLKLKSPVSGLMATGTGTDSMCLLSANTQANVLEYCGKHTQMGEWIGRATYAAVYESVTACLNLPKAR